MNLPLILKRIAMTQMGIAHHLANHQIHDPSARNKLLEESQRINADLDQFIANYKIPVESRKAKPARKRECGEWH